MVTVTFVRYPSSTTLPESFHEVAERIVTFTTCIYALADPRTNAIRYVGKADNPRKRLVSHHYEKRSTWKVRWLKQLSALGLVPTLIIVARVAKSDWQDAERFWIAHYRAQGARLTNMTDGGEGLVNASEETRQKVAAATRRRMNDPVYRAIVFTPERAAKISAALRGCPKSAAHIAKLPQNQKGRHLSAEHAERARAALRQYGWRRPKGMALTTAARQKISAALRGNTHTRGRVMPEHERIARSIAQSGRLKSAEHREKIRLGQLAAWTLRRGTTV